MLSPALFTLYINDLVVEMEPAGIGVRLSVGIFLYVDDVVRLAETEQAELFSDFGSQYIFRK